MLNKRKRIAAKKLKALAANNYERRCKNRGMLTKKALAELVLRNTPQTFTGEW